MKHQTTFQRRRESGYTLLELMIALSIGIVLILAASSTYLVQRATSGSQADLSGARETARMAMSQIAKDIRQAGYHSIGESPSGIVSPQLAVGNAMDMNGSDRISISFYGSGSGTNGDGSITDCLGNGVNGATKLTEIYKVGNSGVVGLYCSRDSGVTWQVVVPDVEQLQILLGSDADNDGSVDNFYPSGSSLAEVSSSVVALDVAIVVRAPNNSLNPSASAQSFNAFGSNYVASGSDLDSVYTPPNDHRFRLQERMLVGLRNRLN